MRNFSVIYLLINNNMNNSLLLDTKKTYTNQLINNLYKNIYKFFNNKYNNLNRKNCLSEFQNELSKIHRWNDIYLNEVCNNTLHNNDVEFIQNLLDTVFNINIRILKNINNIENVNSDFIEIPKLNFFIHKCYIETAREYYKNINIFEYSNKPKKTKI